MKIREAVLDDCKAIAQINVDTWRSAYRGLVPEEILNNLSIKEREGLILQFLKSEQKETFILVAEGTPGEIIGYTMGGPERFSNVEYKGEIYAIYISEEHQRKGVGKLLIKAAARRLQSLHINSMMVWVLAESPYRKFYQSIGGKELETKDEEMMGFKANITAYGWADIGQVAKSH